MNDYVTAFRLFGNFNWPPLPKGPTSDELVLGIVEIYYVFDMGSNKSTACVRWNPFSALGNPRDGAKYVSTDFDPSAIEHLDDIDDGPALALKLGDGTQPVAFRTGGTKHAGIRLAFRGAFLLDQFPLNSGSNFNLATAPDPRPAKRFPLVDRIKLDKDYYSQLLVGQSSTDYLRLDLALASPVPQFDGQPSPYFVPFSALYEPTIAGGPLVRNTAAPVKVFVAGLNGLGYSTELVDIEKDKAIGDFNFCKDGSANGFVAYPTKGNPQRNFWPSQTDVVCDVLREAGFAVDGPLDPKILLGADDERSLSLRFLDRDHSPDYPDYGVAYTYRLGLGWNNTGGDTQPANATFGDIQMRSGSFVLRFGVAHVGWLDTQSRHLYFDYEFRFSLDSSAIWAWHAGSGERGPAAEALIRIGFTQPVEAVSTDTIGMTFSHDPAESLTVGGLLARTIKAMRLVRIGLDGVTSERPRSFLPELRVKDTGGKQFTLLARIPVKVDKRGQLSWGKQLPKTGTFPRWQRPEFRLSLADDGYYPNRPAARTVALEARLPSLRPLSGGTFNINLAHDSSAVSGSPTARAVMFAITPATSGAALDGRLGGLRLDGLTVLTNTDTKKEADYSYLRIGQRTPVDPTRTVGNREAFDAADLDLRWLFATSKVEPIATDRKRGDRTGRTQPLLISLDSSGQATSPQSYSLDVRETLSGKSDWQLMVQLYEHDQSSFSDKAGGVVVSTEPFSLLRFYSRPVGGRGDAESTAVASYDSDTGQWSFKRVSDYFHYVLPPQSVGESMDKPRRLEIHDSAAPKKDGFLRPYPERPDPPPVDPEQPQYPETGLRRHAVEFRLTPSAELWVRPSDVERGFLLPEWATYDIFSQRSELGLGAALDAFRAEFLYGLPVGVLTSYETGPARRARVAEIEALTGHPLADFSASNPDPALRARWQLLRAAIARRQERLELWADDPQSNIPFAPASFEKGVRFALRGTALHRHPVTDVKEAADRWPEPGGDVQAGVPRVHSRGLSGGALWPFESGNVFQSLLNNPDATGGKLEKVALSPLGGDADQKAEFRNGIISIISETRNGFVQRHKVEVLGRIGVYWHRAKHVVVYERTVNPTAQFTPEFGFETRTRRPVLRKVSEYIELLQPERFYPDMEAAEIRTTGCLRSLRFNSKIINVDSAWSEDVADYGWKIPLWNHLGARRRPQVYPRPDIAFVTQAEGEGDDPLAAQECLNPENLYFFTDTTTKSSDTDSWVPRNSIDCADLPAPSHNWQSGNPDDDVTLGNEAQARAQRVPRGHHRFTWRVAPPARRTTINGGRSATPLYAALDTITFMRSVSNPAQQSKLVEYAHLAIPDQQLETFPGYWKKGEPLLPGAIAGDVAASLAELNKQLTKDLPTDGGAEIKKAAKDVQDKLQALWKDKSGRLKDAKKTVDDIAGKVKNAVNNAGALPDKGKAICERLTDDYAGGLQRKKLLLLQNVRSAQHDVLAFLDDQAAKPQKLPSRDDLKNQVVKTATEAIRPAFVQVSADIGNVKRAAETGRAAIRDFANELSEVFDKATRDIDACRQSYDDSKPWSDGRLAELQQKINTIPQRLALNLGPAIDDVHRRMAIDVGDMGQEIANFAARALSLLQARDSKFAEALGNATLDIGNQIESSGRAVANARSQVGKAKAALENAKQGKGPDIVAKIQTLIDAADGLDAKAVQAEGLLSAARADLRAFAVNLNKSLSDLAAMISDLGNSIQDLLKQVSAALLDYLSDATLAIKQVIADATTELTNVFADLSASIVADIQQAGAWPDSLVGAVRVRLNKALKAGQDAVAQGFAAIDDVASELDQRLSKVNALASPDYLVDQVLVPQVVVPATDSLFKNVDDSFFTAVNDAEDVIKAKRDQLKELVNSFEREFENKLDLVDKSVNDVRDQIQSACRDIAGDLDRARDYLVDQAGQIIDRVEQQAIQFANDLVAKLDDYLKPDKYKDLLVLADKFDNDIRKIGNDFTSTRELAAGYGERVLDAAANVTSGGVLAAPNNILRLYAAVASAPEMPNLDYSRDRIGYYFDQLSNVVKTTPVEAWFGRLGDALKALGLSLPIDQIGDRLLPIDLSRLDISRIFRNFGGIKLDKLFPGFRMPGGSGDGIRISHAFDKKAFRAWVQIDVDVPIPGRNSMFVIGPFKLDAVDSNFTGTVRIEASKDTDVVEQTGHAKLGTRLEAVVAGEQMVAFRDVGIVFGRESGLKVEFDPKKIELSAVFQFIQNTLGTIFGDEAGGLKIVKLGGIPVGVSHDFSLPPMSLMFGTSGVTNIQISNHFELVAYPDFVISDRFALAKPELPFLFSVFIIGGTGYLFVDVAYHPFKNELMVTVEAAAGGSAALGFAFAGCTGSVMITISVALTYRKLIGHPGGGLTISLVLLIAGNVSILGIVTVYIGIMLRLSYRDTGDIDAYGSLIVSIQICRFFKLTVRRDITYQMSGGRSQTTTSSSTQVEGNKTVMDAAEKVKRLAGSQH